MGPTSASSTLEASAASEPVFSRFLPCARSSAIRRNSLWARQYSIWARATERNSSSVTGSGADITVGEWRVSSVECLVLRHDPSRELQPGESNIECFDTTSSTKHDYFVAVGRYKYKILFVFILVSFQCPPPSPSSSAMSPSSSSSFFSSRTSSTPPNHRQPTTELEFPHQSNSFLLPAPRRPS